jgi:hypothetical protein
VKRLLGILALIVIGCVLANCNMSITLVVPYCPVSDSAKAKADSIPMPCVVADSVKR